MALHGVLQYKIGYLCQIRRQHCSAKDESHDDQPDRPQYT
jgi:hypothetical protein